MAFSNSRFSFSQHKVRENNTQSISFQVAIQYNKQAANQRESIKLPATIKQKDCFQIQFKTVWLKSFPILFDIVPGSLRRTDAFLWALQLFWLGFCFWEIVFERLVIKVLGDFIFHPDWQPVILLP